MTEAASVWDPRRTHLALARRYAGVLSQLAPLAGRAGAALRAGAPPEPAPGDVARALRKKRPGLRDALCLLIAEEALSGLGRLQAALEAGVADHVAGLRAPREYAGFALDAFRVYEERWGPLIDGTWGPAGGAAVRAEAGRADPATRAAGVLAVLIADGRGERELARAGALLVRQVEEGGNVPFLRDAVSKCLVAFQLWELALYERGLALLCAAGAPPPRSPGGPGALPPRSPAGPGALAPRGPAGPGALPPRSPVAAGTPGAPAAPFVPTFVPTSVPVDAAGAAADAADAAPAADPAAWLRRARRVEAAAAAGLLGGGTGSGAPGWGLLVGYLFARGGEGPLGPCRRLAAEADPVRALKGFCMGVGAQARDSGGRGPRLDPLTDLKLFRWLLAERLEAEGRGADAWAVSSCDLLAAFAEGRALAGSCGPAPAAPPPGRG